jgi:hypothetical protein
MEMIQIAKGIEERSLDSILRIFPVAENSLGNAKEPVPVRHDETLKRCRVTSSG